MFLDTETEATQVGEVVFLEFVFLDLQTGLQDFLGFWSSDGDSASDLFISSNSKGSDGESGLGEDWALSGELFQDFGTSSKPITRLTNAQVQAELGDFDFSHNILFWCFSGHG